MEHKLLSFIVAKAQAPLRPISFRQILPIWKNHLWPQRKSKITPASAIDFGGAINMDLMKERAYFWGYYENKELCGVVSGFCTSDVQFRVRGIWVADGVRGKKVGQRLLQEVFKKALELGRKEVWTMPRASSWGFYEKNGFIRQGETTAFEYGPHYFAVRKI